MRKSLSRRQTPVAFVQAILRAYADRGMDAGPALAAAGLGPVDLADPQGLVTLERFEALSAHAMRELDDEALGWFSRRLPWGSYGMVLRASLPSPDLGVALGRWCRHHNLLTEDVRLTLARDSDAARVRVAEARAPGPLRRFCLVSLLRNLHGVGCWLADSRIPLREAHFPFDAPPWAEALRRMFPGPVRFGADTAGLVMDAAYLELPVVRDDRDLRTLLRQPIPLMARVYRQDRLLSHRISALLASAPPAAQPDAETIAASLGISLRSLQRHLRDEGTSLAALKTRARLERAAGLLVRGTLPIKRIAHLAGYRDETSFSRAFRRWSGQSPAEYRRGHAPAAAAAGA